MSRVGTAQLVFVSVVPVLFERPCALLLARAVNLACGLRAAGVALAGGPELLAIYCGSWLFGRVSQSFLAQ